MRVQPTRGTAGKQGAEGRAGGAEMEGRRTEVAARPCQERKPGSKVRVLLPTWGGMPTGVMRGEARNESLVWVPLKARQSSQQETRFILLCSPILRVHACVCVCAHDVCVCVGGG